MTLRRKEIKADTLASQNCWAELQIGLAFCASSGNVAKNLAPLSAVVLAYM